MRFAIALNTGLKLLQDRAVPLQGHRLVAPTLLRSEVLASLYASVRAGAFTREEAASRLDHFRALRVRLLGDRVQQKVAWDIARDLDWPEVAPAEYVALARLQADAFVTLDAALADSLSGIVPLASWDDLVG